MLGTEEKFLLKAPLCVSIITTNRCNLRCKHCINSAMSEKNDDYLSTSDIKSIIKQCKEIKTVITGGSMSGKLTDCLRDLVVSKKE